MRKQDPKSSVHAEHVSKVLIHIFGKHLRKSAGMLRALRTYPSFSPFSFVSGGYHEMSAGLPSKKSYRILAFAHTDGHGLEVDSGLTGMKTWYWLSLSDVERMSAPCRVCGKKPKIS